ncbi:MAG TPA: ATP-binding protein [Tepidisphaeraceae bacterium]|jgi:signal transduction histidine kinase
MTAAVSPSSAATAQRIEELGRIIMAYSEVTERLEQSHAELTGRVQQLQAELSEKNRELERSNRLAALGEMAAGLAHEIRNPLGGIQLYASLLGQDVADRPESAKIVQKIIGGVQRVEFLVSQVLRFTREIVASPEACDVAQIVRDTVELAQMQIASKSHDLVVSFDATVPKQLRHAVDERLFSQALLNLILNAHEALEEHFVGATHASSVAGRTPLADEACLAPTKIAPTIRIVLSTVEGKIQLVVEDNGAGIPPESLDRIFNPFFTTKDEGTGLGLSIVHRIVEAHNGTIKAVNGKNGGARFEVVI